MKTAKTAGTRTFPWRYMLITQRDGQLAQNAMPVRLAPANAIGDTDWIKVGQTCWDWLNGIPVNWDETRVLEAEAGQYCVTAKRKGNTWFIGGISSSTVLPIHMVRNGGWCARIDL